MKLNIYEKRKVIKTFEADTYDLPFGIMEDVADMIDTDSLKDATDADVLKMVGTIAMQSMDVIKELLHDLFPDITDEDIRKTTIPEIAQLLIEIINYTAQLIGRNLRGNLTSR